MVKKNKPNRSRPTAAADTDCTHNPAQTPTSKKHNKTWNRSSPTTSILDRVVETDTIKGTDDIGNYYHCHEDLSAAQEQHRNEFYQANELYWSRGGYGGTTDNEAMIGDGDGIEDGAEGLAFLDRYISQHPPQHAQSRRFDRAIDLGAGAGRITKLVLLKRYSQVRLVEGDEGWSKRSRTYLGRKRASQCLFVHQRLDDLTHQDVRNWGPEPADLMWVQWTLQYLIDADVVDCLKIISGGLRTGSGILIVKENRPLARDDRFQMDMPGGENGRYDITRTDAHHRLLFQRAGLTVTYVEKGVETNTYALIVLI
jgi:AdoMet dependent proline di-methyltransferase